MLWPMREEEKHLFPFFSLMRAGKSPSTAMDEEGIENLIHLFEGGDEEAPVYFPRRVTSFMTGVIAVMKAVISPAMLVYKPLEMPKMRGGTGPPWMGPD